MNKILQGRKVFGTFNSSKINALMTNFTVDIFMINQSIQNNAVEYSYTYSWFKLKYSLQIQKYKLNAMSNTNTRNS